MEVKIPANWDADKPYVLTDGVLNFYGNGKDIGSHRNSLPDLSTNVPYIGSYSSFALAPCRISPFLWSSPIRRTSPSP